MEQVLTPEIKISSTCGLLKLYPIHGPSGPSGVTIIWKSNSTVAIKCISACTPSDKANFEEPVIQK